MVLPLTLSSFLIILSKVCELFKLYYITVVDYSPPANVDLLICLSGWLNYLLDYYLLLKEYPFMQWYQRQPQYKEEGELGSKSSFISILLLALIRVSYYAIFLFYLFFFLRKKCFMSLISTLSHLSFRFSFSLISFVF